MIVQYALMFLFNQQWSNMSFELLIFSKYKSLVNEFTNSTSTSVSRKV
jgi:hypothetical protein